MSNSAYRLLSRRTWARRGVRRSRAASPINNRNQLYRGLDALEARTVPTGLLVSYVLSGTANTMVTGTVYADLNGDGVRNNGENGVSGWQVYLDLDQSGTLNQDAEGTLEPVAVTNQDGDFMINKLQPGTYRLSEVVQDGWTPTVPAFTDVTITLNKETKQDFLNFVGGDLTGTVWDDLNADGVRAKDPVTGAFTEPGLASWKVYLDINHDGLPNATEPATYTDADGMYLFTRLPVDEYRVTEVVPAGWDISPTFDDHQDVFVTALKTATLDFANFSVTNGSIRGTIWNDVNADGVRGTDPTTGAFTEPGLADWTVFLDLDLNSVLDIGEPAALTNENGRYTFTSLTIGDYEVTEVLPTGWNVSPTFDVVQTVSVVAGKQANAKDFANFTVMNGSVRGTVWNDLNRNSIRDVTISGAFTEPGLSGWSVFLDLNRNRVADAGEPAVLTDAAGGYLFADLQVGDYEVREVLPTGWEPSPTFADSVGVTVFSGVETLAKDFANFNNSAVTPGNVSGTVWNDLNGNGIRDAADPGQGDRVVFIDLNGNGALDAAEPNATSAADGAYAITGVLPGTVRVVQQAKAGWQFSAPVTGLYSIALKNAENATGIDFGNHAIQGSAIRGTVFSDKNQDGVRQATEKGLGGITIYLDSNNNAALDPGEQQVTTSADLYYTPAVNEAGTYSFTHLAAGTYSVRMVLPPALSATPPAELVHSVTLATGDDHGGVDFAAVYRPNEIHGKRFDDKNGNHVWDLGEDGVGGVKIYIDLDRDDIHDLSEPETITLPDGSYSFTNLTPGAYVIREEESPEYEHTYPNTKGGILWPEGVSNPAVGNVSPTSITLALAENESHHENVSITLPNTGSITSMVDVFLLFDDTGSFVNNSPIVRAAFPTIMSQLQVALPGIDLGFGVGRLEEYGNFAAEYATGRPFILNQPIVAASTPGYSDAIKAALNRTTPGYGGDQPETDIEALYQLVTGVGFDGNNNGSVLDSGVAGLASTQLNPGASGDVPSFASFMADPTNFVMPAAGNLGGGGFRAGALPIILLATDTGFAYQPRGETSITGLGGLSLPLSAFTQTSRPTTPFNSGAGIQQTVTGLNALGALVIGLGTNPQTNIDPRQALQSLSQLTGAINNSTTTIANGTATPIAPGDPLYFQIASGFADSVANGVVSAIQNGVTTVALDIDVQASDPRVHIINHSGVRGSVGSGQTATFDIEFIGNGIPSRFDLQFVRSGTNVVVGSIPVVIGTPIPGDCYEFEDLEDGEHGEDVHFGGRQLSMATPSKISGVVVNGGNADRSRVTSLSVAFDQHVNLPLAAADAFRLQRHSDAALVSLAALVDDTGAGTVVTLTFTGGATEAGSLQDGRFDLTVFANSVTNANGKLDGNGDGTGGDDYQLLGDPATNKLFRLFGDSDGDNDVDTTDFGAFRAVYGGTSSIFDFDNDGDVDTTDFGAFRGRFGASV